MANLAIKGDEERSKDIFNLFKMLGGKNTCGLKETVSCFYYYMLSDNLVVLNTPDSNVVQNSARMTIDEFEKEYPYKVGDKVTTTYNGLPYTAVIKGMRWSSIDECVLYQVGTVHNVRVESILPVKEETTIEDEMMEFETKEIPVISIDRIGFNGDTAILVPPEGFEFYAHRDKVYIQKKKPQYPKTYEECCKILNTEETYLGIGGHKGKLLQRLQRLLICRDAYWKIAGEEMGLEKPWEPDYDSGINKYGIICMNGVVQKSNPTTNWERHLNKVLDFPTEEMRDAFYVNFKDLIEQCKELL